MKAAMIFLVENENSYKTMAIVADVRLLNEDPLRKSKRYEVLESTNDLSSKNKKKIEYYQKIGFFESGTLIINNTEIYAGSLTFSTTTRILGITLGNNPKYRVLERDSYILDISIK